MADRVHLVADVDAGVFRSGRHAEVVIGTRPAPGPIFVVGICLLVGDLIEITRRAGRAGTVGGAPGRWTFG